MNFNLQQEWANVSDAPLLFFGTVIVAGAALWLFVRFIYKARIERLEQDVKSEQGEATRLRARLIEYEQKAGGSPDEAQARIARLEMQVEALTPKRRHLTDEQRKAILDTIGGIDYPGSSLTIAFAPSSAEAAEFARQIADTLREGGWTVPCNMVITAQRVRDRGLNLEVPSTIGLSGKVAKGLEALRKAGLRVNLVENPKAHLPTLFVDMAD